MDVRGYQSQIENCFGELLQVLPEPVQQEIVNERLWSIIGTLELLLPRITYKQALEDGFKLKALGEE